MPLSRATPTSSFLRRGVACLALIAAGCGLAQCDRADPVVEPIEAPDVEVTPTVPAVPTPTPALDRAALLAAASRAASAYASGQTPEGVDAIVGRAFSVTTPFACGPLQDGATQTDAPAGLARAGWGVDRKTIQLRLDPGDWTQSALMAQPGADSGWEAVEGFWLARPWMVSGNCPTVQRDPLASGSAATSVETVGLAAVFSEETSRVARRNGRAYVFTVRPENEETPLVAPADGYRVLIEGRIGSFPGGRAFRCRASGPEQRPVCIAAMSLDRVAFTQADGTVLTEWRPG